MYFKTLPKVAKYIDVAYKFDFMSFANQNHAVFGTQNKFFFSKLGKLTMVSSGCGTSSRETEPKGTVGRYHGGLTYHSGLTSHGNKVPGNKVPGDKVPGDTIERNTNPNPNPTPVQVGGGV